VFILLLQAPGKRLQLKVVQLDLREIDVDKQQ
jgi:hypothetical protein